MNYVIPSMESVMVKKGKGEQLFYNHPVNLELILTFSKVNYMVTADGDKYPAIRFLPVRFNTSTANEIMWIFPDEIKRDVAYAKLLTKSGTNTIYVQDPD